MRLKYLTLLLLCLALTSFNSVPTLKGIYVFQGGMYNGKPDAAPKEYTMQRNYTDKGFTAYAYQKGYKTEKYEAGNYVLKADSCLETQTFSSQPSKITGKTIHYTYKIVKGELILSGTLPTGMVVEEHWKKVK
jgi:hypothetical protein